MILEKEIINDIEVIYSSKDVTYKKILILIPGGGKLIGASRFIELQERLSNENIGSVSINFAGVEGSLGSIETDNLENRINKTISVIDWVKNNFIFEELSLYGISMGGYVILGTAEKLKWQGKIVLHTPAAYAKESIQINFNEEFTKILRTPNSWRSSESFNWLKNRNHKILFITHSKDDVIPKEITDTYKDIIFKKENSKVVEIDDAKHSIWTSEDINKDYKKQIILEIVDFL